ncbi:hypothetical protein L5515_012466 [Caenorhabditis briggsae]|uniref:Uncharacterized protein n=1 Tax=Caenorhabditis briggsae TaxID=6238 RepID=A0AAE9EX53_CAEBR|nr:hypothetical protein L5515_012466 [Caenorhabditis briggsae]
MDFEVLVFDFSTICEIRKNLLLFWLYNASKMHLSNNSAKRAHTLTQKQHSPRTGVTKKEVYVNGVDLERWKNGATKNHTSKYDLINSGKAHQPGF